MAKLTSLTGSSSKDIPIPLVLPGFYDLLYAAGEIEDLKTNQYGDLIAEIALLRVLIRRALTLAHGIEDLEEILRVLNTVGQAVARLARLLEVQFKLIERSTPASDAITQALLEISGKLGIP